MDKNFFDKTLNSNSQNNYEVQEMLDFLNENNTYYVEDKKSGVVGDKKTGVMLDKRTGKMISSNKNNKHLYMDEILLSKYSENNSKKYDFLDYKKALDVLKQSDNYYGSKEVKSKPTKRTSTVVKKSKPKKLVVSKKDSIEENSRKQIKKTPKKLNIIEEINPVKGKNRYSYKKKQIDSTKLEKFLDNELDSVVDEKFNQDIYDEFKEDLVKQEQIVESLDKDDTVIDSANNLDKKNEDDIVKEELNLNVDTNLKLDNTLSESLKSNEEAKKFINNLTNHTDEELLNRINSEFNKVKKEINDTSKLVQENVKVNFSENKLNEEGLNSSFEDFSPNEQVTPNIDTQDTSNFLDITKFSLPMDLEEYLLVMQSKELILKSPFEYNNIEKLPQLIETVEEEDEDFFSPFDVEEIKAYNSESHNMDESVMGDLGLNKGISKKVSIREVIKKKQQKKQEDREIQEKMFFETLDERIDQFKKFKENSSDSEQILKSINMDLNKINTSIRIEFDNFKNKGKNSKRRSKYDKNTVENIPKSNEEFSLQNLLEEIYEERGQGVPNLDTDELDIDRIKKDLAKREESKKIVN